MPEFGNSIVVDQGFKNIGLKNAYEGFQVRVRISYYRGIVLSIVDGEHFGNENISFSLDNETFIPATELGKYTDTRWEFGDKAYLHIKKPGGLARGRHKVKVTQKIAVPYLPFSTAFFQEKVMTIV